MIQRVAIICCLMLLFVSCASSTDVAVDLPPESTPAPTLTEPTPVEQTVTVPSAIATPTAVAAPTVAADAASPVGTDIPACQVVTADPGIGVRPTEGDEALAIELVSNRAVGGLLRRGDSVAVVNTTPTAQVLLPNVKVLDSRTAFDLEDPDSDPADLSIVRPVRVHLGVETGDVASLTSSCESGSLTLAQVMADGGYAVELKLPGEHALNGEVRLGDRVSIFDGAVAVLPGPLEVLTVSVRYEFDMAPEDGIYGVLVRVRPVDLAALVAATTSDSLRLERPADVASPTPTPEPLVLLDTPDGHDVVQVNLPASHTVIGNVMAGDFVALIGLPPPTANLEVRIALDAIEVLGIERVFDPTQPDQPADIRVFLAMEPGESDADWLGGAGVAIVRSLPNSRYELQLELRVDQVRMADLRSEDFVTVVGSDSAVLAEGVQAVLVQRLRSDGTPILNGEYFPDRYTIVVELSQAELLRLVTQTKNIELRLIEP